MNPGASDDLRIVFVDWHRVLSDTPFLSHLPGDHWMNHGLDRLFYGERELCAAWQRGTVTEREVLSHVFGAVDLAAISEAIATSVTHMQIDADVLRVVDLFRGIGLPVILATDNMPAFATGVRRMSVLEHFDDLIVSCEVRALKAEDPAHFFGGRLGEWDCGFENALLIDDRLDNCGAFERAGGHAIRFTRGEDPLTAVRRSLESSGVR